MGWMSPQELNDNPKRWLDIPHDLHGSLLDLQEKLFPGFTKKLDDSHVHCFLCNGEQPFEVIIKDTGKLQMCTGYVGDILQPASVLLHTTDKERR